MADVVDIVHKLSIQVDSSALQELSGQFAQENAQVQQLQARIAQLDKQLDSLAANDIENRQRINALIADQRKQIDQVTVSVGRQVAENKKLSTTIVDATGKLRNLTMAGSQLLREAPSFTYSIQTGILALSNNIPILLDQLQGARASGAKTSDIFLALGRSVFGLTGLITIAVSVLTIFGNKIFDSGTSAEAAAEKLKKYEDELKSITATINETNIALNGLFNEGATAYKNYADLVKAQGVVAGNVYAAEKAQSEALRDARLEENRNLQQQIDLFKQIADVARLKKIGGTTVSETDLRQLIPDAKDRAKAVEDIRGIQKASEKAGENTNQFYLRIIDSYTKEQLKLATKQAENLRQNEIDQVAFDAKIAERRYELQKQLTVDIKSASDEATKRRLDNEKFLSGESAKLIKARENVERNAALRAIDLAEEAARKTGALDEENARLFNKRRAQVNKQYNDIILRQTREFYINLIKLQLQFALDQSQAELTNQQKELSIVQSLGDDTLATRNAILQKETEVQNAELDKRYSAQFELARKNGIDTTQLTKDYEQAKTLVILGATRDQFKVYSDYYAEQIAQINESRDKTIRAIQANGTIFQRTEGRLLQERLRAARKILDEASENQTRVANDPNRQAGDLDAAVDKVNQARIGVRDANNAIQLYTLNTVGVITQSFNSLAQSALSAFNLIADAQEKLADRQASIQEERVNQAIVLAQRGNTEILKQEQERLDAINKKREEATRRQVELNALAGLSNSAVALTEATKGILAAGATTAAEGGGIIGYIAALAAGFAAVGTLYASIKTLSSAEQGFADGVVNLQGPGTTKSDSIRARLSRGESVMTAEATAKYDPVLRKMNAGVYIPELNTASYVSGESYATRKELHTLNQKMDTLIDVAGAEKINTKTIFDAEGVREMHSKTSRKNRIKWD